LRAVPLFAQRFARDNVTVERLGFGPRVPVGRGSELSKVERFPVAPWAGGEAAPSPGEEAHLARPLVAPERCGDRNRKRLDGAVLTG
jgi:hypothetical protein